METILKQLNAANKVYQAIHDKTESLERTITGNFLAEMTTIQLEIESLYRDVEPLDTEINRYLMAEDVNLTETEIESIQQRMRLIRGIHFLTKKLSTEANDRVAFITRELSDNKSRQAAMTGYSSPSRKTGQFVSEKS